MSFLTALEISEAVEAERRVCLERKRRHEGHMKRGLDDRRSIARIEYREYINLVERRDFSRFHDACLGRVFFAFCLDSAL